MLFYNAQLEIMEQQFHRNAAHKLVNKPRALYYALISYFLERVLKWGIPREVNFVLIKGG